MPRGKVEANAEVWRDRVQRWKASGLTSTQFAAQEGLPRPKALSWWAHYLSHRDKSKNELAPALQLVRLETVERRHSNEQAAGETAGSAIEIRSGGHRIEVRAGFDEDTLRRVLSVLESSR